MIIQGRLAPGTDGFSGVPELTIAAVEAARWDPGIGCLIDRVHPGLPLVLSFGYVEHTQLPPFDFFKPTKRIEERLRCRFNRILVRDVRNAWYHRGVPGLGADVDEVAGGLRGLIDAIRPVRVVSVGQSMGGYAAILFGLLLGVDRIVAFGPLSHLDPDEAIRYGDRDFLGPMKALRSNPPAVAYTDLVSLGRSLDYRGELHVVFGTHPREDDGVSSHFDAVHALRLSRLSNVTLLPYPESDHSIVPWLVDRGLAVNLLAGLLEPSGPRPAPAMSPAPVPRGPGGPMGGLARGGGFPLNVPGLTE